MLYQWLHTSSTRHRYARFFRRHDTEWLDVMERFSVFYAQSLSTFASIRVLSSIKPDQGSNRELTSLRQSYTTHCEVMFNVMARFLARAVLACEPNEKAISKTIGEIGFSSAPAEVPSFPADQVACVSIGLLLVLVIGPAVMPHLTLPTFPLVPGVPPASIPALTWTTHVAAILTAVLCKHFYASGVRRAGNHGLVVDYCKTFAFSLLAASGAALLIFALTHSWSSPGALLRFPYVHFTLYAAVTAITVAIACDIRWGALPLKWQRCLDALLCGSVVAASLLPLNWTIVYLVNDPSEINPVPPGVMIAVPLAFGFVVTAIPGACIPTWYRASVMRQADTTKHNLEQPPFAELRRAVLGPLRPGPGQQATGYGMTGVIATVPECQPLAQDGIWRVNLVGEVPGRLVRRAKRRRDRAWQLLQIDDLNDAQFDAYEAAISSLPEETSMGFDAPSVNKAA